MNPPVLLLDDNPKLLEIYRGKLRQHDYTLETTDSFGDALQRLEHIRHPVVVSDLRLIGIGDLGGFELLERKKIISEYTKVIIITAFGGAATSIAREAMIRGASSYFTRPLDFDELDEAIVMAIKAWRQEIEESINFGLFDDGPELAHLSGTDLVLSRAAPLSQSVVAAEYQLKKIRHLLNDVFSIEELRDYCFEQTAFRPVHEALKDDDRKPAIIRRLLDHARQKGILPELLAWAKEANPARYTAGEPYEGETA